MPQDLHVVRTQDFLRCNSEGAFDYPATRAGLAGLARTCIERGLKCVLLDIRDTQSTLNMTDMYNLARTFHETGFQLAHRLAILHRYRAGERAEFFALCAKERGWNVQAFESYEDAVGWFTSYPQGIQ